jgi:DNA modification methylase
MAMIPDKSVDLIVIDPPYNIGKDKRWDKWKTVEEYVSWMTEVFKECERVLKSNGSFYWFHNDMTQIWRLMHSIESETNFVYKQFIVWNKRFYGANNKGFLDGFVEVGGLRNYQKMAEYCLYYTFQDETGLHQIKTDANLFASLKEYIRTSIEGKEDLFIEKLSSYYSNESISTLRYKNFTGQGEFRLIPEKVFPLVQEFFDRDYNSLRQEYELLRREYEDLRYTYNNQKTHHSVWNYEIAPKQGHVTPKPIEMIESIIRHSSNEGDIVLDCFMGSGTTAVAAARLNRNFIGFERESEYVRIANQRLEAIQDEVAERKLTEE